nr:alpha-amylase [Gammaproteobacteria bacterium]
GNKLAGQRTRTHGDYHLGQVLYTGRDFVIIDFEGEPARPIGERRIKRSPIRDVAGMLRSFDYAVRTAQHNLPHLEDLTAVDAEHLAAWATLWRDCVSWAFLSAYRAAVRGSGIIPAQRGQLSLLLDVYLLEKALYELAYELNHRPDWVDLPLAGLLALLERPPA